MLIVMNRYLAREQPNALFSILSLSGGLLGIVLAIVEQGGK